MLDLRDLVDVFEAADARFVMQEGNALGWGRYKDIMEWDEDIDIAIPDPLTAKQLRQIYTGMNKAGWRGVNVDVDFIFSIRNVKFNGWIWHHEAPYYVSRPTLIKKGAQNVAKHKCAFPERFFLEPQKVSYLGKTMWVPNHLDEYLTYRYGEWKDTIIKSDDAWKKQEEFVYKWQQIMPLAADPAEVNKEFLCESDTPT
jgi:phosphorylcholine metabolism protein LicD